MGVFVAKGKTITSRKGILQYGDEVKPEYLGGGGAAIESLLAREVVVQADKSPVVVAREAAAKAKADAEKKRKAMAKKASPEKSAGDGA